MKWSWVWVLGFYFLFGMAAVANGQTLFSDCIPRADLAKWVLAGKHLLLKANLRAESLIGGSVWEKSVPF